MLCDSALGCLVTKGMECNKYCGSGVPLSEVTPVEMELGSSGVELHKPFCTYGIPLVELCIIVNSVEVSCGKML